MHHVMIMHQLAVGITMVYRGALDDNTSNTEFPALLEDREPIAMLRLVHTLAPAPEVQTCLFKACSDYEAGSITNVVDIIYSGEEYPDPVTQCWSFEVDIGDEPDNTNPVIILGGNAFRLSRRGMCIETAAVCRDGTVEDNWGEASDWSDSQYTQEQVERALGALHGH